METFKLKADKTLCDWMLTGLHTHLAQAYEKSIENKTYSQIEANNPLIVADVIQDVVRAELQSSGFYEPSEFKELVGRLDTHLKETQDVWWANMSDRNIILWPRVADIAINWFGLFPVPMDVKHNPISCSKLTIGDRVKYEKEVMRVHRMYLGEDGTTLYDLSPEIYGNPYYGKVRQQLTLVEDCPTAAGHVKPVPRNFLDGIGVKPGDIVDRKGFMGFGWLVRNIESEMQWGAPPKYRVTISRMPDLQDDQVVDITELILGDNYPLYELPKTDNAEAMALHREAVNKGSIAKYSDPNKAAERLLREYTKEIEESQQPSLSQSAAENPGQNARFLAARIYRIFHTQALKDAPEAKQKKYLKVAEIAIEHLKQLGAYADTMEGARTIFMNLADKAGHSTFVHQRGPDGQLGVYMEFPDPKTEEHSAWVRRFLENYLDLLPDEAKTAIARKLMDAARNAEHDNMGPAED